MKDYAQISRLTALLVIVAGLLTCFWGYRILKMSLAIFGLVTGAFAGWQLGLSLANGNDLITLGCALVGGVLGIVLYLWLYFVAIFLIGATAGVVVASAFFSGMGHQVQPIVFIVLPIAFGVIALLAQRFMIILSTAFSGAYLIMAGIWPFVLNNPNASRVWLYPGHNNPPGTLGYGALGLWILLALLGIGSQLRAGRRKTEPQGQKNN